MLTVEPNRPRFFMNDSQRPFWQTKSLNQMTTSEWESLCDGCGRCCLNKLEDWDTGEVFWTNIACSLLDRQTCQCRDYENRFETVSDCINLSARKIAELSWLPPSCAYRLIHEGKPLFAWHPLISGDADSVHKAGVSVRGRCICEQGLSVDDYEDHLVDWPEKLPGTED